MPKHKKKTSTLITVFASLILTVTTMAGCSGNGTPNGNAEPAGKPEALTGLTYWVELFPDAASIMKSYGEVTAWKEIEAKTGVKVEFQHPAQGQLGEQFNLTVASNSLPDVIEYWWNSYPGGAQKAIRDEKIIPLNDYLEYAPNLKKLLDANPEWKRMASTDDGDLIGFPFIRSDSMQLIFMGPVIRKDWLDKLNLSVPSTIDEWYMVLKAFKEKDPNGNGQPDEIPLLVGAGDVTFAGAFGVPDGYYHEGDTVKYGPIQPEFKQYLATMNQWYSEGLLDKDFATTDGKMKDAKITGNQVGSSVMFLNGGLGKYLDLMQPKQPEFKLVATPYPTLKPGEKPLFGQMDNPVNGQFAAITGSNKNVIETVKFLDYLYSEEGQLIMNFGKEGLTYTMVDGYPKFTSLVLKNPDGLPISQSFRKHIMGATSGPFVQDVRFTEQYVNKPEQIEALKLWAGPTNEKRMPPVTVSKEESSRYSSIMTDINTYKDEMILKFIMGAESLDKFDGYVKTIKGMGIDEAIQIQQSALEHYNNR